MKRTHQSILYAAIIVWLHAIIGVLHGLAHIGNGIWLSLFGNAFVLLVITLAPLLALLLLYSRWQESGALLLALSMLGALIFGLWYHFITPGIDNVAQVHPGVWHFPFLITSILLAALETLGVGIGLRCLYTLTHPQDIST